MDKKQDRIIVNQQQQQKNYNSRPQVSFQTTAFFWFYLRVYI